MHLSAAYINITSKLYLSKICFLVIAEATGYGRGREVTNGVRIHPDSLVEKTILIEKIFFKNDLPIGNLQLKNFNQ